jgi:pyruvate dehydrogenase E2 component (dihydrolipoamide acetyltransferase)
LVALHDPACLSSQGAGNKEVSGSVPRGRVQGEDARQWAARAQAAALREYAPKAAQEPVTPAAALLQPFITVEPQVMPLSNIRRTIAERLQRSVQKSPHIYLEADIDVGALEELRKRGNARVKEG